MLNILIIFVFFAISTLSILIGRYILRIRSYPMTLLISMLGCGGMGVFIAQGSMALATSMDSTKALLNGGGLGMILGLILGVVVLAIWTTIKSAFKPKKKKRKKISKFEKATHESFDGTLIPISEFKPIPFIRRYSADQFKKMEWGRVPKNKNDNWFIFVENNTVFFYRPSTGFGIYIIRFEFKDDEYQVVEALVNTDKEQYDGDDVDYDIALIGVVLQDLITTNVPL